MNDNDKHTIFEIIIPDSTLKFEANENKLHFSEPELELRTKSSGKINKPKRPKGIKKSLSVLSNNTPAVNQSNLADFF